MSYTIKKDGKLVFKIKDGVPTLIARIEGEFAVIPKRVSHTGYIEIENILLNAKNHYRSILEVMDDNGVFTRYYFGHEALKHYFKTSHLNHKEGDDYVFKVSDIGMFKTPYIPEPKVTFDQLSDIDKMRITKLGVDW